MLQGDDENVFYLHNRMKLSQTCSRKHGSFKYEQDSGLTKTGVFIRVLNRINLNLIN